MPIQPVLDGTRVRLRPFADADAPVVQRLAGDRDVAGMTREIPHPYLDGMAEAWMGNMRRKWGLGEGVAFAVCLQPAGDLIGCVSLAIDAAKRSAEMGYWIGKPYWNQGYATDAARRLLAFGFGELGLQRISAHHLTRNPGSGRVMQKIGLRYEGRRAAHVVHRGGHEDIELYGLAADDYRRATA